MASRTAFLATLLVAVIIWYPNGHVTAKGAGRAFPIPSENFAIDSLQRINPSLEWDVTNFLVDLSGHYAHCKVLNSPPGVFRIHRLTPQGESIIGVADYIEGRESDSDSVNGYIQTIIGRWQTSRQYNSQVQAARIFGCSVRPTCGNYAVVVCLFTPGYGVVQTPRPTIRPTIRTTTTEKPAPPPPERIWETPRALAFTSQQYNEAEGSLGRKWDRSHYLENLSGYETSCDMIGTSDWSFPFMKQAEQPGSRFIGQYGIARNRGSTPDALREILSKFRLVTRTKEIGCSLIPDCISPRDGQMYVVVSCLFEEGITSRYRRRRY